MAIKENDNRFLGTKSQQGGAQSSSSGNQSYNSNRILGGRSSNSSGYVSIYNKRGAPNSLQRDYDDYLSKFNSAYDYLQSGQGDSATTQSYLQEAMNASNNLRTFANTTDDGISGDVKLRYRDLANSFDKLAPYLQNMAKEQGAVENYNARINADANIKDLKATLAELQNKKGQALSLTAFDTGAGYDYGKERGSVTDLNKAIAETKAAIKEQEAIKQNSYSTDEEREEILGRNNWMSFFRGSNVAKGAEHGEEYYLDPVTGQYVYAGTDAKALQSYQDLQRLHEKDSNELLNGDYAYGGEKLNRTLSGGFAQTAGGIVGAIETIADYGAQERQKLIDQGGETYYDEFLGEDVSLNNVRQLQAEAEKYQAVAERAQDIYNTMDEQSKSDIAAAKAGLGKFGQFAVDLGVNAVQMGTDMVFGAGASTLLPMAVRVFGQEAQAAKAQGYDVYKQLGYGVTKAGIEMATEKIFGMFDKIGYGKGVVSGDWEKDLVEKLAGDKLGRFAARFVLAGLEEGGEEVLSELFSPLADAILTGKVDFSTIDPAETLYSFLIGAAMGSIGTVGGVVTGQNADADAQIDQRATNRMLPKLSDENAKLNKSESKMRDLFNRSRDALAAIESGQAVPDGAQLSRSELIRAVDAGIVTVTEANTILQNETVAAQQATEIASDMSPEDLKKYEAEHGKKAAKAAEKRAQKQADFLTRADENQFGTEQASFEQAEAEELAKQQAEQTPQNLQNKAPQTQDAEKGTQTLPELENAVDTPSRELNSQENLTQQEQGSKVDASSEETVVQNQNDGEGKEVPAQNKGNVETEAGVRNDDGRGVSEVVGRKTRPKSSELSSKERTKARRLIRNFAKKALNSDGRALLNTFAVANDFYDRIYNEYANGDVALEEYEDYMPGIDELAKKLDTAFGVLQEAETEQETGKKAEAPAPEEEQPKSEKSKDKSEQKAIKDKGSFANLEITKHENLSTDTRTVATVSTKAAENGKISEKPVADAHAEIAMTKDIVLDDNSNADSWRNALIKEIGDNIEATGGKVKANALNGAEVLINTEGAQAKTLFRTVFTDYDIDGRRGKSFDYNETILAAETQFPTVLEKGQLVDLPSINEDGETKWGNPEKFAIAGYVEVGSGDKVLVCCQIAAKQTATGTEYSLVRVVDGESCAVLNFKPAESESAAPVQAKAETKESANAEAKKNLEDRSRKAEKARLLSSDTKWTLSDIAEAQMITEYDRLKLNHDMASGNMTTTEFNLRMDEIKRLENRVKSETELFGEEAKNVYEKSNGALVLENAAKSLLSFSGDTKARPDSNRAKIYLRIENAVRSLDSAVEAGDIDGIIRSIKQSNKARGLDKAVPFGLGEKFQNNMLKDLKANGLTADDFARMAYGSIYGITSDFVNTSFLDKVRTVRILNALSNPATAINNVANNEVTGTVNAIGHNVGYFLDRALGNQFEKITGKAAIGKDYSVGIWNRKFGKNNERRAELLAWEYSVMASMSGVSPDSSRIDVSGVSAFDHNGNLIERALSLYSFMINATVLAPDAMSKARAEIGLQKGIDEKISKMFKDEDLQKTLDDIRGEEARKLESELDQIHEEYESGRNPPKSGSMSERAAELLRIERSEGKTEGRINSNERGRAKRFSEAKENAAVADAKARSEERIQKRIEKAEADWNARKEASRAELEEDMRNEKLRRAYQDDNKISNAVVKARNAVDEWSMSWTGGKVRLGSFGVLFAKVPTNVVKMAAEGTPLYAAVAIGQYAGMIHKAQQMHDAVVRGDPGAQEMSSAEAAKAIRNLGRAATHGIGMTVLGFVAAMTGALKYFDPDDDSEEAKRAKEKGITGLQFNFGAMVHGGEWDWDKDWIVGGDWLEIIAPAMTIGASIAEARKDSMSFPETIAFAAGNSFSNMLSLAENIPGLQQAAELYNGYANASVSEDENNRNWKKMMNAGSQYMASSLALYALPNATQNLAAGMDNTVRDIYNTDTATQKMWNIIKSKEIFLRKTIPEKLDSFGKTRAYGETKALGVVNKLLLPGDVRILSTSATEKELNRLVNEGYSGVYPKTTVPRKFTANGQDYVMNADQRRDYQEKLAITYTQYMEDAMDTSWYKDAPDSYKAKALNQLRLTAERETKNYLLQSMGALDEKGQPAKIKLDKWEETLTATSDRVQYLMSKQEVSELYDDNVLQSYADMDSYLKDNYSKLTPDQKTLLNNSYSFLDDMYDASKHGINSEQWTQAHDIYKKYAEDKDKKKNQMNTAAMWAEFSKIPGMSGSKLSYVEDNMRLYNMAPVNVDKLNELNSIGLNPDKVAGVSKAISELPVLEGHSGVLNNQKYEAIAKLSGYSDEEKWKIFLTYATDTAIRDVRAKWNQREARGWSFAQCLHEAKRDVYK